MDIFVIHDNGNLHKCMDPCDEYTYVQYDGETVPGKLCKFIVAVEKPSVQWTKKIQEAALDLVVLYGPKSILPSEFLFAADQVRVTCATMEKVIRRMHPFKDIEILPRSPIAVMTLSRNNASDIKRYIENIRSIEDHLLDVYILENDSVDGTPERIKQEAPDFTLYSFKLNIPPLPGGRTAVRTAKLAHLRNRLKDLVNLNAYEYVMVLDTEVQWTEDLLKSHIKLLKENEDIVMSTSYGYVKRSLPCQFHFDTYATVVNGTPLGFQDNLFQCDHGRGMHDFQCHRRNKGHRVLFQEKKVQDIDSGCGGLFVCRAAAMKNSQWGVQSATACEHWKFCSDMRQYGRIVVNPEHPIVWNG